MPTLLTACSPVGHPGDPANDRAVITSVTLTFAPQGGGEAVVARHRPPSTTAIRSSTTSR
ncbi:MAG: hypothetical protein FJ137_16650 [Deltaproteobacteria bacterium]|nr:hypothetical protein [Deltaproteobacteria bacterium]